MTEYRTEHGVFYNGDCMEGMAQYPEKYFDIAIVDPPYGITKNKWDIKPINNYFVELYRISTNQIIWGANYFVNNLFPSSGWIYWDKLQNKEGHRYGKTYASGELAYTSFKIPMIHYEYKNQGNYIGEPNNITTKTLDEKNIHPTQKPVALYKWLIKNYVKQGQRIIDTHVGSASSLIAYEDAGLEYVGYELDVDYYKSAVQRIKDHKSQLTMFPAGIA